MNFLNTFNKENNHFWPRQKDGKFLADFNDWKNYSHIGFPEISGPMISLFPIRLMK
jgi:hypothetical protein